MKARLVAVFALAALFLLLLPMGAAQQTEAVAPQQLRRAEPPSADATVAQLEKQGDELRMQKAYADALDYYRAALRKDPNNAVLYNKAGIAELQLLHSAAARKNFERAVKLNKNYAEAYNNLGVSYYFDHNYKKAIKYYLKALEVSEGTASFHSNLGTAYFERKQLVEATREYLRALELDPDIFERISTAGVTAHLASPEDRAHYHYVVAKMYAQVGKTDRCLLYLRKAKEESYANLKDAYKDKAFAEVRKDPRFAELMGEKAPGVPD